MPTPSERLAIRKAQQECRVCAWLSTLNDKDQRGWTAAIGNTRFGAGLVASEINVDMAASDYDGITVGESSVQNHRQRGHK